MAWSPCGDRAHKTGDQTPGEIPENRLHLRRHVDLRIRGDHHLQQCLKRALLLRV